jgi:uncharacterized membrane protein YkvA (DUF1232 family)
MKHLVQSFYSWYRQTLRNPKYRWLLIGASLLYLICPFDIAPDFIPMIGLIDDGIIATLLVTELSDLVLGFFGRNRQDPFQNTGTEMNNEPQVIEVEPETVVNNEI